MMITTAHWQNPRAMPVEPGEMIQIEGAEHECAAPGRCEVCGADLLHLDWHAKLHHRRQCTTMAECMRIGQQAAGIEVETLGTGSVSITWPDNAENVVASKPSFWRLSAGGNSDPREYTCTAFADFSPTSRDALAPFRHVDHTILHAMSTSFCNDLNMDRTMQAMMDLVSAHRHLERLLHGGSDAAQALRMGLKQHGTELADAAAGGILSAFDEAEALCLAEIQANSGSSGSTGQVSTVFDTLVHRWEAHVPMGLLMTIEGAIGEDGTDRTPVATLVDDLRCLRAWYEQSFTARGFQLKRVIRESSKHPSYILVV